jgi:hypothetical protein
MRTMRCNFLFVLIHLQHQVVKVSNAIAPLYVPKNHLLKLIIHEVVVVCTECRDRGPLSRHPVFRRQISCQSD